MKPRDPATQATLEATRYRGRRYKDDPRALPPRNLVRLIPDTISGCGCSAATAAAQGDPESPSNSRYRRPAHERARRRIWGADKMFDG